MRALGRQRFERYAAGKLCFVVTIRAVTLNRCQWLIEAEPRATQTLPAEIYSRRNHGNDCNYGDYLTRACTGL